MSDVLEKMGHELEVDWRKAIYQINLNNINIPVVLLVLIIADY